MKRPLAIAFWVVAIALPIAASLVAIAQFPPGADIPLHWNVQLEVDRWGSPWAMLSASLVISGVSILLALSYLFSDKLYDLGLIHGVSRKATRPFLCGTAAFIAVVIVVILLVWTTQALAAMA